MIRPLAIAALLLASRAAADPDLLRFSNGDQIHGEFTGMDASGAIHWERPDVSDPIPFQRDKVRHIVLHSARSLSPIDDPSHLTLIDGDRFPGRVISADESHITLATHAAGTLSFPRDAVAALSPNPFGGRLIYAGPFDTRDWKVIHSDATDANVDPFAESEPKPAKDPKEKDRPTWQHLGSSWVCGSGSDGLILDAAMPDRALLRFKLAWRSRPNISVAFHADLTQPESPKKVGKDADQPNPGRMQNAAEIFGSGYILNIQSGYANLQRTRFDAKGNPEVERLRVGGTSIRLNDTGESVFEIRCDRHQGTIAVHVDGQFAVQWNTASDNADVTERAASYQAKGGGIGFQMLGNTGRVRISDLVIAEWNGLTDSARSMESDDHDIVLLANGTDRFSGKVLAIRDEVISLRSPYSTLRIPTADIAEIRFARKHRASPGEASTKQITVHLQPVGRISGTPVASTKDRLQLETRHAGKIDLDLTPAVVVEFQSSGGFLDAWDESP